MGVGLADLNEDGVTDFLVTNTREGHVCVVSDGPEHWAEMADSLNVAGYQSGWGAQFFDADNDMDEDLFLAHGAGVNYSFDTYNMLLINEGWPNPFTDLSSTLIINDPNNRSFGMCVGDLDHDGLMDVFRRERRGRVRVLPERHAERRNWIVIIPEGTSPTGTESAPRSSWRQAERPSGGRFGQDPATSLRWAGRRTSGWARRPRSPR